MIQASRQDHGNRRFAAPLMGILFLLATALVAWTTAPAQEQPAPAPVDTLTAPSDTTAMVVLDGRNLFRVGDLSVMPAKDRAAALSAAIREAARNHRIAVDDLRMARDERIKATLILAGRMNLGAVWDHEAEAMGTTADKMAAERLDIIREAIQNFRHDYSPRALIRDGVLAVVAIVLLVILLKVLSVMRGRFEAMLSRRIGDRTLFKVLEGESIVGAVGAVDRLVHILLVVWLVLTTLNFLLSLFPWTAGLASQVFDLAAGPLRAFGRALVAQVPSYFFLLFIAILTGIVLRGIGFFFDEIGRERIRFKGFYPDWARPTFNIIRVMILAFAVVVAFPYIPGSGSDAFKGMSLFIGVLVSFGSGSAMANIISGVILIYMRPFAIGDRVQIGETLGDVVDRTLLTTRLRTPKNERVTIPNTNILSGQIINFTAKARLKQLILHTTVTIGYDVPWRTVHELLLNAARQTENVMQEPAPFVLQKGLHDFYVEYELNVYTDNPRRMAATYSDLHQAIQDSFDEAGVEILSPHYRMLRREEEAPPSG